MSTAVSPPTQAPQPEEAPQQESRLRSLPAAVLRALLTQRIVLLVVGTAVNPEITLAVLQRECSV